MIDMNKRCSVLIEHVDTRVRFRVDCYGVSVREAMSISLHEPNFGGLLAERMARRGIILCGDGGPWVTSVFHIMEMES